MNNTFVALLRDIADMRRRVSRLESYDNVSEGLVTNGDNHDHSGGDGAPITEDALSLSDVTTNDTSTTKHGFCPKLSGNTSQFLRGDGTWATPSGSGISHYVILAKTGSQSIPNSTWTAIQFDSEEADTDGYHNSTHSSRITIPSGLGGLYIVGGRMIMEANSSGVRYAGMFNNGEFRLNIPNLKRFNENYSEAMWSAAIILSAGDYIEFDVFHSAGTSINVLGAARFWAVLLCAI